jgi:hypothetical protein
MTTYLRLLYPQLLPDLLHSNATGNVCYVRTFTSGKERPLRDGICIQLTGIA